MFLFNGSFSIDRIHWICSNPKKAKTTGHLTMILPGVFNSLAFSPTTTQRFLPLLAVYNHPGRKQYDSSTPQKTAVRGGSGGEAPTVGAPTTIWSLLTQRLKTELSGQVMWTSGSFTPWCKNRGLKRMIFKRCSMSWIQMILERCMFFFL